MNVCTQLDFAQIRWGFVSAWECSSGEACRVEQAVGERSGDFYHVPALAGCLKESVLPELSAHSAAGVTESQVPLGIPGGAPGAEMAASDEVVSPEGDKGDLRQQGRRGAGDGF